MRPAPCGQRSTSRSAVETGIMRCADMLMAFSTLLLALDLRIRGE